MTSSDLKKVDISISEMTKTKNFLLQNVDQVQIWAKGSRVRKRPSPRFADLALKQNENSFWKEQKKGNFLSLAKIQWKNFYFAFKNIPFNPIVTSRNFFLLFHEGQIFCLWVAKIRKKTFSQRKEIGCTFVEALV